MAVLAATNIAVSYGWVMFSFGMFTARNPGWFVFGFTVVSIALFGVVSGLYTWQLRHLGVRRPWVIAPLVTAGGAVPLALVSAAGAGFLSLWLFLASDALVAVAVYLVTRAQSKRSSR
ncbi:hypothetical protein FHX37_3797 [Haloactinospora alba]|uniref:Uncharacterized protein n=1 Tax=Haloactinospora alba TaxID=405555 RepID=A0A543N9D7_9ACTN|nr:hypothetical protein [Haloactinospora alba]TQN28452.1 hypothetical protein FHX37_3797 [Haloactinospora alba]